MIDIEIPSAPPFKNRRPGLIGCGIVHLLLGLLLFLMCALILVSLTMMPEGAQSPTPVNVVVYACLLYLALAAFFATLGVGSILGRRWSRPLILITSWGWLLCGASGGAMYFVLAPRMFDALPPEQAGMKTFMAGFVAVVIALFGVALPAVFILFYRGTDVKKTAWYEAMGMPADPAQVEMMRAMYSGPFFQVWMGVIWAAYLGFLLYIRRFFTAPQAD